jgi:ribosomal protein S18 acetylase RimI-like enzyme
MSDTDELRDLVDRWVEGWSISRSAQASREGSGAGSSRAWLVEVAAATRLRERVVADPSVAELRRLVAATSDPATWLSIVGELDDDLLGALKPLEPVTHAERMMSTTLRRRPTPDQVILEIDGRVAHARVEIDGRVAARGQAVVVGRHAVIDRISTEPEFRRRGLGRLVMSGLENRAIAGGATTGLLFASVDGRRLYDDLGWREVAPLVTYRGRRPAGG